MAEAAEGDERVVRAALRDALSLNVFTRVRGKALRSAVLVVQVPMGPWRQMVKDAAKCNHRSCGGRVLPDTYSERDGGIMK